ncbi:Hypothetical protein NTJ_13084 [Nesidiocoris tenuis]|uniref:Uncharacterized protein n=1 Tax=Nesidiocoris tenuis TaxID=355587 RepID=A0ABN7BBR1_9HEMI|nr:Hypothetical protein NTJ_13084 [Nesidiocoris tenuis]
MRPYPELNLDRHDTLIKPISGIDSGTAKAKVDTDLVQLSIPDAPWFSLEQKCGFLSGGTQTAVGRVWFGQQKQQLADMELSI